MTEEQRQRLRAIKTFGDLTDYLRTELDWPIEEGHDEDDLTFDWSDDLGLKESEVVGIREIKQLRPLETDQPWGIFFVNFEKKQLPIVILRRILNALVMKKRTSANKAQQAAWRQHDLLFISSYGEDTDRQLTFAHFSEPSSELDASKATLRVLGWDDEDTNLKLDYVANKLHEKLTWPQDTTNLAHWRQQWAAAFELRPRQVITTAEELALRLAELAKRIRNRMLLVLPRESESGELRKLLKGFQTALIHDLDEKAFADMYAQTITYGLFSAAVSRTVPGAGTAVDQGNIVDMVPVTNPFLKEMLQSFLKAGGRKGKLDFDELGIQEVVDLLNNPNTHLDAVLRDFGNKRRDEDPVIHFYEDFLKAYDKQLKVRRGVFYTPQPVVSYIVRSVHELLRTEFGLADGLADTTTWGEMLEKHPGLKLPPLTDEPGEKRTISPDEPFVQILDPATGTATFLVEVIDVIHRTLAAKWKQQRLTDAQQRAAWNDYVPQHLLPRLHAYELMMAPYAIAHMKIGLKLAETGYNFGTEQRARIYLTNALEPWVKQLPLIGFDALAHEAAAVNEIKRHKRFTVVIGNPPYSPSICEPEWLMRRLDDWKQGLNETKSDLNREEWKFLRLAQHHCTMTGTGIVGFIINRDFLDGIVKRRMREHLSQSFPLRIAVDLNGDVKGNIADENVFEIEQGVAISILSTKSAKPGLRYASRVGTRAQKYADLIAMQPIDTALADVDTPPPYFRWMPYLSEHTAAAAAEYAEWPQIKSAFGVASSGIQTKRDGLCVAFTRAEMWEHVQRFHTLSAGQARDEFDLGDDGRDWTVTGAKADLSASGPNQRYLCPILYRPLDVRFTYWTGRTKGFLAYPRREVMQHIVGHKNMGMIFNRQIVGDSVSHFSVARIPICHGTFYLGNKGQDYFAPLLAFDDDLLASQKSGRSNFTPTFLSALRKAIGAEAAKLTPEDIFHYAYAVFHSPGYRSRYAEFLKIDFPRLPLTGNLELFRALARLGGKLTALHLLESPKLAQPITEFIGGRRPEVEKISWSRNTVWVDKAQTIGFRGVPEAVWNFHIGGYQVCEKWLKDRKGRRLSADDIAHYHKIVVALAETIRLMAEIDRVIDRAGGWPGAFTTGASA
ncbi:MAG: type ISP restriction/modification enzyme [Pseudomonadota bacterium]